MTSQKTRNILVHLIATVAIVAVYFWVLPTVNHYAIVGPLVGTIFFLNNSFTRPVVNSPGMWRIRVIIVLANILLTVVVLLSLRAFTIYWQGGITLVIGLVLAFWGMDLNERQQPAKH
ncbi:hypothetical protein [Schleiferilactobacillus perolens]|uniref:Uncharacterized protein n=1 Tax=Schleiferilactobacillus perolens DSM 12744 TaxID=1423792 RepID=A0A0R1MP15_9LACO|nr:hypothetical protein [Schleiferilactobacillus perolens]KRL09997.1 hypothetical protein FD09_GL001040 [Schleiferilactobacillus perolens DSM 12744]